MTDYNKLTVAKLREVLKERGIPSTGLTRKAQIIEKLEEADHAPNGAADAEEPNESALAEPEQQEGPLERPVEDMETVDEAEPTEAAPESADATGDTDSTVPEDTPTAEAPGQPASTRMAVDQADMEDTTVAPVTEAPQPEREVPEALEHLPEATEPQQVEATASKDFAPQPTTEGAEQVRPTPEESTATADATMEDVPPTPPHDPNEAQTVEEPELPLGEETLADPSIEPSRLNSEELKADTRKRKRRSGSPDVPKEDIQAKKHKPADEFAPDVHLKEDKDVIMGEDKAAEGPKEDASEVLVEDETAISQNKESDKVEEKAADAQEDVGDVVMQGKGEPIEPDVPFNAHPLEEFARPLTSTAPDERKAEPREKDSRFKSLLQTSKPPTSAPTGPAEDRDVPPALHPATPAVYIRNFMRPLRPDPLRNHLISLASPPSSSPDPSVLKSLFLDNMRTHALALFTSTSAAARVRASLHGSKWPQERDRKELWVDFVPEDKVEDWIEAEENELAREQEARRSGNRGVQAKRYEVVYEDHGEGMEAIFQEVGAFAPPTGPSANRQAPPSDREPHRPSNTESAPSLPAPDAETKHEADKSFQTLDTLFRSTLTKPKLYYLPVDKEVASKRLDELDAETSRDWNPEERIKGRGRSRLDEKRRFGFEGTELVDIGHDIGPWGEARPAGGDSYRGSGYRGRGGGRGGGRGQYGGIGYTGGGGDSWRGRGGGWRSGP
ncbi:hypothetical protein GQ43DRAFT_468316 [Delitschia confertaspora ATCC 74209]|uniref:SAP domain-containing protein n=1 Tax=Delitschia confertaspora ATCC 74209 TaxID=1513339 RepID=A0A9P4N2X6_9PLEO|nr:hypothetical protein GQ43DRAFT_468316 [Delitschia confertaspora ATCC 74209]